MSRAWLLELMKFLPLSHLLPAGSPHQGAASGVRQGEHAEPIFCYAGGRYKKAVMCSNPLTFLLPTCCLQKALIKEQPVVYNKENMLNPFFVVFGRRRGSEGEAPAQAAQGQANKPR